MSEVLYLAKDIFHSFMSYRNVKMKCWKGWVYNADMFATLQLQRQGFKSRQHP